jgi:hypothetical protein
MKFKITAFKETIKGLFHKENIIVNISGGVAYSLFVFTIASISLLNQFSDNTLESYTQGYNQLLLLIPIDFLFGFWYYNAMKIGKVNPNFLQFVGLVPWIVLGLLISLFVRLALMD